GMAERTRRADQPAAPLTAGGRQHGRTNDCNTGRYHSYRVVRIGSLADRYADRSLPGDTTR
ncbi:hypothetical protein GW17_00058606, partial [Ensete ventricosum]